MLLALYMVLQIGVCYYISKRLKSESDYFVAGHSFPLAIVSVSLFATWFGAETCIGSSGAVYAEGLSGSRADPFGYGLCLILSGLLIAGRIWSRNYITLADFYKERFGGTVEQMAVWLLGISSLIWGAAQMRAFAQVIGATTELPLEATLLIALGFVLTYTLLGGMMGDMISDVIQAVVIAVGLISILVITLGQVPDLGQAFAAIPAERLSLRGAEESWWARLDRWAVPIFGSLVAQEIVARIFSSKSKTVAVKACYWGAGIYIFLGCIPVVLGLLGPQLIHIEGDSEQFLIRLAKAYLPPVALVIFSGALISALLSTMDSILLSVGALVSHNFLIPRLNIQKEKRKLLLSRMVVLIGGLITYIVASYSSGIYELLSISSSFGTAGILVITLFGLWSKIGDGSSALAALGVGIITTPIAQYLFEAESPFLISILASLLAYLSASSITKSWRSRVRT